MSHTKMQRDISHWECGDLPEMPDFKEAIRQFIDDNVYEALKEFGKDISMLVAEGSGETYNPDRVCLYLGEGRSNDDGTPIDISTAVSLKDEILLQVGDSVFDDGAIHPEDCANTIKFAEHLESIAKILRERVAKAESVTGAHKWTGP